VTHGAAIGSLLTSFDFGRSSADSEARRFGAGRVVNFIRYYSPRCKRPAYKLKWPSMRSRLSTTGGFSRFTTIEIPLYHTLSTLPEPESAHKFC